MNSTFSKMAPYIKLLQDVLTGNRISLFLFLSFLLSFPFYLCLPAPLCLTPVHPSPCLFLNSAKTPAFSLCVVGSSFNSVGFPGLAYHIIWAPGFERACGQLQNTVKSMEVRYLTGTNKRASCERRRWTPWSFSRVWDHSLLLSREANEQSWYQQFLSAFQASPVFSHRIISFHAENKNGIKN